MELNLEQLKEKIASKLKVKVEDIYSILDIDDVNKDVYAITLKYGESVYVIDKNTGEVKEYLTYEPEGAFFLNYGDIVFESFDDF